MKERPREGRSLYRLVGMTGFEQATQRIYFKEASMVVVFLDYLGKFLFHASHDFLVVGT